eukprot:scaffold10400_cov225-Isochrysis_galbana.AAC.4
MIAGGKAWPIPGGGSCAGGDGGGVGWYRSPLPGGGAPSIQAEWEAAWLPCPRPCACPWLCPCACASFCFSFLPSAEASGSSWPPDSISMWQAQISEGRLSSGALLRLSKMTWTSSSSSTVTPIPRKKQRVVMPVAPASDMPSTDAMASCDLAKISMNETYSMTPADSASETASTVV